MIKFEGNTQFDEALLGIEGDIHRTNLKNDCKGAGGNLFLGESSKKSFLEEPGKMGRFPFKTLTEEPKKRMSIEAIARGRATAGCGALLLCKGKRFANELGRTALRIEGETES